MTHFRQLLLMCVFAGPLALSTTAAYAVAIYLTTTGWTGGATDIQTIGGIIVSVFILSGRRHSYLNASSVFSTDSAPFAGPFNHGCDVDGIGMAQRRGHDDENTFGSLRKRAVLYVSFDTMVTISTTEFWNLFAGSEPMKAATWISNGDDSNSAGNAVGTSANPNDWVTAGMLELTGVTHTEFFASGNRNSSQTPLGAPA